MPRFAAFIRGINVVGKVVISMTRLKQTAESAGLKNPQTLLNSGNLLFDSSKTPPALEKLLEKLIAQHFDLAVHVMVRTAPELQRIIASNPFPDEARTDPSHLLVMFFKDTLLTQKLPALVAAIQGREKIVAKGREAYITYPDGIGKSKFSHALIEKTLTLRGTMRNWNTLMKTIALLKSS